MQLPEKVREVQTSGVTDSVSFGISKANEAHIKSILRDNIYSDKILAVLREYSANAWDAHRMAGKPELPIEVHIPTWDNLNLTIKDFGPGLSHEDVFQVFTQYGSSTKRGTNDAVGMLGIGSKSGFAYSDTFTVTSRHGGKARTYVALLDEADNDALSLLNEVDCGDDTGLTIQIAIRKEDHYAFQTKARDLFKHFKPRPKINIDLPQELRIRSKLKHGVIFDMNSQTSSYYQDPNAVWYAVMGCIPYKVDLNQLVDANGTKLVSEAFTKTGGLLEFDIGDVQVNASREGLKYSNITKDALVKKFENLLEEFIKVVLDEIENLQGSGWEKRIKAQTLLALGLGVGEAGIWGEEKIPSQDDNKHESFKFTRQSIPIRSDVRLVKYTDVGKKKVDKKKLKGFELDYHRDIGIERKPVYVDKKTWTPKYEKDGKTPVLHTWDEVDKELAAFIEKNQIDGIPIVELHTLPWKPSYRTQQAALKPKVVNPKHTAKMFRLSKANGYVEQDSDRWEIAERTPTTDDAVVILSHFQILNDSRYHFRQMHLEDCYLAEQLGLPKPEIYGYKTTDKKPLLVQNVTGTFYPEWRKKWLANIPKDKIDKVLEIQSWFLAYSDIGMNAEQVGIMVMGIGKDHPISKFYRRMLYIKKHNKSDLNLINKLSELGVIDMNTSPCMVEYRKIADKYPVMAFHGFGRLGDKPIRKAQHYQRYIKLVDMDDALQAAIPAASTTHTEPVSSENQETKP